MQRNISPKALVSEAFELYEAFNETKFSNTAQWRNIINRLNTLHDLANKPPTATVVAREDVPACGQAAARTIYTIHVIDPTAELHVGDNLYHL